jgi:hypothetical protein
MADAENSQRVENTAIASPTTDDDDLGDQVAGLDPDGFIRTSGQSAADVAQRGRHDLDVQQRDEHADAHAGEGQQLLGRAERSVRNGLSAPGTCVFTGCSSVSATRVDLGHDGQARTQQAKRPVLRVEQDTHRHALDDLGEVAGRIFDRQDAELRSRGRCETGQMAVEDLATQDVGADLHRRPFAHARQLVFLEIGIDPQAARRDDGQQLSAGSGVRAQPGATVADHAVDRRPHLRITNEQSRGIALGLRLDEGRFGLLPLRGDHFDLALRGDQARLRMLGVRHCGQVRCLGALRAFQGNGLLLRQRVVAQLVVTGTHDFAWAASTPARAWWMTASCSRAVASRFANSASCAATAPSALASAARKSRSSMRNSRSPFRTRWLSCTTSSTM